MFGGSLHKFLGNLDNMHTRVGLSFPQLKPPSFVVRDAGPRTVELEYHSRREGLAPIFLTWLVTNHGLVSPSWYYMLIAVISVVGLVLARRVYRQA